MSRKAALPTTCFSLLGPLPVSFDPQLIKQKDALGYIDYADRTIRIQSDLHRQAQQQAFFHEMTHIALWDAGAHNSLSKKQVETVCDAIGTYLAAAVQAGFLKVKE